METMLSDSTMHNYTGNECKRLTAGALEWWVKILNIWPEQEAFSAEGLESGTIMKVCRQQWSIMEVPCKFGAAFLQMELEMIHHTIPSERRLTGPKIILHQYNDPNYTANVIKNYVELCAA